MQESSTIDWRRVAFLVAGNALSLAGDFVLLVALGWTAVQIGGAGAVTTLVLAQTVPRALMLIFGGAIADGRGPRFVVLRATGARVVVLAAGAAVVLTVHAFWPLVVIAVLEGVMLGLASPATGAMMATLANGDQLVRANSLYSTVLRLAPIIGAPIGAWLIAVGELWQALVAGSVVCAVVFAGLLYVTSGMTRPERTGDEENLIRRSGAGFRLLAGDHRLLWLFVSAFCLDLAFGWPLEVALPLLANGRSWGVGAVGIVVATFSAGALTAGALGALLAHRIPLKLRLVASGVVMAAGIATMVLMPSVVSLAAVALLVGAMAGLNGPAVVTAYQQAAPRTSMGAAMATLALSAVGTGPVSIAAFSALSLLIGTPATWVLCGVIALAGPVAAARALRRREEPAAPRREVVEALAVS
ncbi:MFS transporter [Dactylosporangium sp. CA-092794]|uniref:MFS transporter n=1 Tax=Dactylosporangium sp. CA-092794 TaxID=3239929 RepID=UPI003D91971E